MIFKHAFLAASVAAATAVSTSTTVFAETQQGVTITPSVGYMAFDSDRELENDFFYSLGLGYQFGNPWALELLYLDSETEVDNFGLDVDQTQIRLDALYHFQREGNWQPYLAGGVGQNEFEAGTPPAGFVVPDPEVDELTLNFGGGFKYYFNDVLGLRTDIRGIYGEENDDLDFALSLGLQLLLGGSSSSSSPAPAAKPQAPTPAAPGDADNDGVIDTQDQCPATPAGVSVDSVGCPLDSDGDGVADYQDDCPDTAKGARVDEKGCYILLTEDREVRLNVQFATNSDVVPEAYYNEIKNVADFMREYVNTSVVIEGHTDDRGAASYNQNLSERRAAAVAEVLVTRFGIDASRVSSAGYGEERPQVSNDTAENRALNRRVVAVVEAQVEKILQK
jgi:OOP family OmpA-OmpF porin